MEEMVQHTTVQIKGSWRFHNSTHLYTNSKNTLATALLLILPWFGMIYLMRSSSLNSSLFEEKGKIISLQKDFPNKAYTLSGVSIWYCTWQQLSNDDFFKNLIMVLCLIMCLAKIKRYESTEKSRMIQ